jgi:antitoxin MazE
MQVSKWGNSLAVRLPAAVVKALELKEGDEVEIQPRGARIFEIALDSEELAERGRRQQALENLRALRANSQSLPEGYKFSRAEIYGDGYRGAQEIPES